MTATPITSVEQLLRQGRIAVQQGDRYGARQYFQHATELDPDCADAWWELGHAIALLAERRDCLQRTLALDPARTGARASLQAVQKMLAEGHWIDFGAERMKRYLGKPTITPSPPQTDVPNTSFQQHQSAHAPTSRCEQCPQRTGKHAVARTQMARAVAVTIPTVTLLSAGASVLGAAMLVYQSLAWFALYALMVPASVVLVVRLLDRMTKGQRGKAMLWAVCGSVWLGAIPAVLLAAVQSTAFNGLLLASFTICMTSVLVAWLRPAQAA